VLSFGAPGTAEQVGDEAFRAEDRRQALRIAAESGAIGLGVAVLALVSGRRGR
jgi:hypothetical protein